MSPVFTDTPWWVGVVERIRHIFAMNSLELTQVTLFLAVGFWWLMPGDTWAKPAYEDFRAIGLPEDAFGLVMVWIGVAHAIALWARHYRGRRYCSALAAMFWFSLAVATFYGAPLSTMAPMTFVTGVSVLTTYWRLGGRK